MSSHKFINIKTMKHDLKQRRWCFKEATENTSFCKHSLLKVFLVSILCFFVSTTTLQGQNPDTLKKITSYDNFPLGAMRFPSADTLEQMLGMNYSWFGFGADPSFSNFPLHEQPYKVYGLGFSDPLNRFGVTTRPDSEYYDWLRDLSYSVDFRAHMPGTDPIIKDYRANWSLNKGKSVGEEWIIPKDTVSSGEYVLSDFSVGGGKTDPYTDGGWGYPNLNEKYTDSFYYDLIYSFAANDLTSLTLTEPLYIIEYWVKPANASDFAIRARDTLTKARFQFGLTANSFTRYQNINSEKIMTWGSQKTPYKIKRMAISLIDDYIVGGDGVISRDNYPQVDIRIRTLGKAPLRLKGLRIRDWKAHKFFESSDVQTSLNTAVNRLLSRSSNATLKSWTIGNEPTPKSYRSFCLLNELITAFGGKPLNVLAPYDYEFIQRIAGQTYTNGKPPIFYDEQVPFTGRAWRSWYTDTTLGRNHVKANKYWDMFGKGFLPSPLPSHVTPDSAFWNTKAIFVVNDYHLYTHTWQDSIFGYSTDNGSGRGWSDHSTQMSKSCYETATNKQTPYWLTATVMNSSPSIPKWVVDSQYHVKVDSIAYIYYDDAIANFIGNPTELEKKHIFDSCQKVAEPIAKAWAGETYDSIIAQVVRRNPAGVREDSLFDWIVDWRTPSIAEQYWQVWSGVLSGMKGLMYNIGYDDGQNQGGFLADTANNVIWKSHERTYMHRVWYTIKNPYNGNEFEPINYRRWIILQPTFKTMFNTIRAINTEELAPIVNTLKDLRWYGRVSWHRKEDAGKYFLRLPIKSVETKNLSNVADEASETYVDFGIHRMDSDAEAIYVSALNRRIWTDSTGTEPTDTRVLSFKIDTSKVDKDWKTFTYWSIKDISGKGPDTVIEVNGSYAVTLKPGRGALLRIAPVKSFKAGRSSVLGMAYNNGRRIAELKNYDLYTDKRAIVWERNGNIEYSIVNNPTNPPESNFISQDSAKVLDNSGHMVNPSIAAKGDTIGIVYAEKDDYTVADHRIVFFRESVPPYTTWTTYRLDTVAIGTGLRVDHIITPSVAPARVGFACAWSHVDSGIRVQIVHNTTIITDRMSLDSPDPSLYAIFPSVATREERMPVDDDIEYIHLAWEEWQDDTVSNIYYTRIDHELNQTTGGGVDTWDHQSIERVSKNAPSCEHHHPNIAVTNLFHADGLFDVIDHGEPIVTWEMVSNNAVCDSILGNTNKRCTYVMLREKDHTTGLWDAFKSFYPKKDNLPLPVVQPSKPFVSGRIYDPDPLSLDTLDVVNIAFQDTFTKQVHFERAVTNGANYLWQSSHLMEYGQYPSLALNFPINMNGMGRHVVFRGITKDNDDLYEVRVNSHEHGIELKDFEDTIQSLNANDGLTCEAGLSIAAGGGNIGQEDQSKIPDIHWPPPYNLYEDLPPWEREPELWQKKFHWLTTELEHCDFSKWPPTGCWNPGADWIDFAPWEFALTEDVIKTTTFLVDTNDILTFKRFFQIKNPTAINAMLGLTGKVMFKILMKDPENPTWVRTVDSIYVDQTNSESIAAACTFDQNVSVSFDPSKPEKLVPNVGLNFEIPPSKQAYLTMVALKDSTAQVQLTQAQAYQSQFDMYAEGADAAGLYKKGDKQKPIAVTASDLSLSVYPNPFNPTSQVVFSGTSGASATVEVYNALGRSVAVLYSGEIPEGGTLKVTFDGSSLASGSYFVRAKSGNQVITHRVQLLK